MKSNTNIQSQSQSQMKVRGSSRISAQQAVFELKHKVVIALNKLADRDTYQVAAEELQKTAECLSPDSIAPFLSCILDTASEHKTSLRRECVALMGTLVRYHHGLMAPHLSKMLSSIVKRLKDSDSVVRDACVNTVAILASNLTTQQDSNNFVLLLRPLFEALGEQHKQVQWGSALCLASLIDNAHNPPLSLLQRMLTRTTKLLKNPHFLAKPALIELNRSIIQAGGAPSESSLSAAMTSIQESLKSSDWLTRKAACVALSEIASTRGSLLLSFKASCIRSLESCRFDKVKPVRDTVLHALQCWKTLPGTETPEPSEAGSSIKENFCGGDYSDMTSASESGWKDFAFKKVGSSSTKGRVPLSVRKKCQNYVENTQQQSKEDDWRIEIAVPKTHAMTFEELNNEESEGSSVTKAFERLSTDVTSMRDIRYEYVHMDDKQECSSVSNLATGNFEPKLVHASHHDLEKRSAAKLMERDQQFSSEETCSKQPIYSTKIRDRRSLESTLTESGSPTSRGCCLQMANEMVCIRTQLMQIQEKQSNMMDLLQVFSNGIMDGLAMLQSRVVRIEDVVDRLSQEQSSKQSQILHSARHSTSTPRPSSVDINNNRQPSKTTWPENVLERSLSNTNTNTNTNLKMSRDPIGMKNARQPTWRADCGQARKDPIFGSTSSVMTRKSGFESKHGIWKRIKGFVCQGDLDAAYAEALSCGDELILVELFDSTGPVLECLSTQTVTDVLTTLASYLLQQKYTASVIPWMQQVVELSNMNGPNYLVLTTKARQKLLSAIKDAVDMDFSNPLEKRCIGQMAMKLQHIWGNAS